MSARELLREVNALGVELTAKGGRLIVRAPAEVVTAELRRKLVTHKSDLLRMLAGNWSDGQDARWSDQRQRFCVHLFGCTDCSHPENIHCPTGARLLAAYRDNLTIH